MFSEQVRRRLHDIVENIDRIDDYITGLSQEALAGDGRTIDAVERCLQRITEAVIQIGQSDIERLVPDISFARIRGMGNRLRHEYHRIDAAQVYITAVDELPPLRAAVFRVLNA